MTPPEALSAPPPTGGRLQWPGKAGSAAAPTWQRTSSDVAWQRRSNRGQIPIQDSDLFEAPGVERNWALTLIAVSERVSSFSPRLKSIWGQSSISFDICSLRPRHCPELESDPNYSSERGGLTRARPLPRQRLRILCRRQHSSGAIPHFKSEANP